MAAVAAGRVGVVANVAGRSGRSRGGVVAVARWRSVGVIDKRNLAIATIFSRFYL